MGQADIGKAGKEPALLKERIIPLKAGHPVTGDGLKIACGQVIGKVIIVDDGAGIMDLEQRIQLISK